MSKLKRGFDSDFLWGGAISCSQADGAWNEGGKGKSTQDCRWLDGTWTHDQIEDKHQNNPFCHDELMNALADDGVEFYPFRRGNDFYHHYREDIALFAEMGLKLFRTSICWSRIYPNGDDLEPNREGIEWYRSMLGECKKHGIKTFVTMLHYDIPVNLVTTYGGWKNRKTIDFFARYVETIVRNWAIWSISGCLLTSSMQRVFPLGTGSVWSKTKRERTSIEPSSSACTTSSLPMRVPSRLSIVFRPILPLAA